MVPVGNVCPYVAYNSLKGLWFGDGVVFSWELVGCVLSLAWYLYGRDFPPDSDSLAHISISFLSERLGLFRAREVYFGERLSGGGSLCRVFF